MNYGLVSAVLLNKIALFNLDAASERTKTPLYPIIGVGSAPFRGNLRPDTVDRVSAEYPSAHTFTIQSAFKYDYPLDAVQSAVRQLENGRSRPVPVDEKTVPGDHREVHKSLHRRAPRALRYRQPGAAFIPGRRKRKLHMALWLYPEHRGHHAPRAIHVYRCHVLNRRSPGAPRACRTGPGRPLLVRQVYVNFDRDLLDAVRYMNPRLPLPPASRPRGRRAICGSDVHDGHKEITGAILSSLSDNRTSDLQPLILQAAAIRKFLG